MKKSVLILLLVFVFFSCEKDDFSNDLTNDSGTDDIAFQANFGQSITADFIGRVLDVENNAIQGARVSIDSEVVYTDHNGVFVINNAQVYEKFAYLKVGKEGYIEGSRALVPKTTGNNVVRVVLLEKEIVTTVDSGIPSSVGLTNGAKVEFQGDFVDAQGNQYNGQVQVSMHYLPPNQVSTFDQMPGMLLAQDTANNARMLETYGMLAVNLYSPSGQILNIAPTSTAVIHIPIDSSTPNSPEIIPLWYFDEDTGYWKEEGDLNKFGDKYVGEVSHFTWWNADLPMEFINLCFSLVSQMGMPSYNVVIKRDNGQVLFSGLTNEIGEECGLVPKDESLTVKIFSKCDDDLLDEVLIGPFSDDVSIEINVSLDDQLNQTNLQGLVSTCTGSPITQGYLYLLENYNGLHIGEPEVINIVDGQIDYDFNYCSGDEYSIIVYDIDAGSSTGVLPIQVTPGITNLGNILTCISVGGVYDGSRIFDSQQELLDFALLGYDTVTGYLSIGSYGEPWNNINDLSPLINIKEIQGSLTVIHSQLTSFSGLSNLETIGSYLNVIYNDSLENFIGLESLTSIGSLHVEYNSSFLSLDGLESLDNIETCIDIEGNNLLNSIQALAGVTNLSECGGNDNNALVISSDSLVSLSGLNNLSNVNGNIIINGALLNSVEPFSNLTNFTKRISISGTSLTSLVGLENLQNVQGIELTLNPLLTSLNGLENLISANSLWISYNDSLVDLTGLNNLTNIGSSLHIGQNSNLTSLEGLNSLASVDDSIWIGVFGPQVISRPNPNLTDFCAIEDVFILWNYDEVIIQNNAYNPTTWQMQNGYCSQ
ncbi:MAG: hypothetical protein HRT68_05480 [Flavobacteriaceae bacterium]|nr:hypothetical protein [Flavobacteriaceae bacterium]